MPTAVILDNGVVDVKPVIQGQQLEQREKRQIKIKGYQNSPGPPYCVSLFQVQKIYLALYQRIISHTMSKL